LTAVLHTAPPTAVLKGFSVLFYAENKQFRRLETVLFEFYFSCAAILTPRKSNVPKGSKDCNQVTARMLCLVNSITTAKQLDRFPREIISKGEKHIMVAQFDGFF